VEPVPPGMVAMTFPVRSMMITSLFVLVVWPSRLICDANATFQWLENAYQAHETRFELASQYFDGFRPDPRYADFVRRVGQPL
jgi:hypothetical protein